MKKLFPILGFLSFSLFSLAQSAMDAPEMADTMRSNGKIYVVVAVLTLIFLGIILFLVNLDRKVKQLEDDTL